MTATGPCINCGQVLSAEHRGYLPNRCEECRKSYNRERMQRWRADNPDKYRAGWMRDNKPRTPEEKHARWAKDMQDRYGLSVEEYVQMEADQDGKCAICSGPPNGPGSRLHVDHCHATGKVRGLLCGRCNTAIGLLKESSELMALAAKYLKG